MSSHEFPALFRAAEAAAARAQVAHLRTYKAFVWCSIVGAGLALYGINSRVAAAAAAAVFTVSLGLSIIIAIKRFEATWYSARAVAESIKTNVWRFMMRAEPYENDGSHGAQSQFRSVLRGILVEHKGLGAELAGVVASGEQLTDDMLALRALGLNRRMEHYRTHRIDEQRQWYSEKGSENKKAAEVWFRTLVCLQLIAVFLTIGRVAQPQWGMWPTEVFVVAGAGVLGWTQTKRFRELASAYTLTAHEIGLARNELVEVCDDHSFSQFVNQTENAFSREHTQWVARRE
jgi:hypothetical protein